jgi:deoxyribonuclease-4
MADKRTSALFGSGGNPKSFYDDGNKETVDIFKWLKGKNIDSYEYQAGTGLKVGALTLNKIRDQAVENNIAVSLHAPYFISITSEDDVINANSVVNTLKCVDGATKMGAYIIVIHSGSLGKNTRDKAMEKAKSTISKIINILYRDNKTNIQIGLETMGKQNQLGTLEEVTELCKIDEILYPVVDFGHLNARNDCAQFKTSDDYQKVFDKIGESLSDDKAKYLHCHFSKIEYTQKGEKKHLTFEDKTFGPEFEPLAEVLIKNNLYPNIICESDGTMDIDTLYMKNIYENIKNIKL